MSIANNKTVELWRSFMPHRKEIANAVGQELYSMQIFGADYNMLDPNSSFEKWAAVEVSDFDELPINMESTIVPAGKYAVFLHKGTPSDGYKTFRYIFETWLPQSGYELDQRPHFEVLGEKYKNNDPESEEEVFIPIR